MMSVPFCALPLPSFTQTRKIEAIRESVFYRVILVIGMGSEIIGQRGTEIIGEMH